MAQFRVRIYCEDHATWLYDYQSVVDPSWVPAGHEGDTLRDFTVVAVDELHSLLFRESPTGNGSVWLLGWHIKTDNNITMNSASPRTQSVPGYHAHTMFDILTSSDLPFTVRVTGTSVDEIDGSTTPGDTEDVSVAALGDYQTSKSWITAPELSIIEASKSCTLHIYRNTYWDKMNTDFVVHGARLEWEPDSATWSMQLILYHIQNDGSYILIDDVTFDNTDTPPRAENGEPGKYKRIDYDTAIEGSAKEGLMIRVVQTNIRSLLLNITHHE